MTRAPRWRLAFGRFLVNVSPDGTVPLNAQALAEFKGVPAPSVVAMIESAPEAVALLAEGAHLCEYEEADDVVVADYRHRCARLAARITGAA